MEGKLNVLITTEHKGRVGFCLQLLSETILILRITDQDTNAHMCSCKVPVNARL